MQILCCTFRAGCLWNLIDKPATAVPNEETVGGVALRLLLPPHLQPTKNQTRSVTAPTLKRQTQELWGLTGSC